MKYAVLFQLDQECLAAANRLINQTRNAAKDIPELQVEWVIHGKAVHFLCRDEYANSRPVSKELSAIKSSFSGLTESMDLKIFACKNALLSERIEEKHVLKPVEIIPSGVGRIIRRQAEGCSYIKIS